MRLDLRALEPFLLVGSLALFCIAGLYLYQQVGLTLTSLGVFFLLFGSLAAVPCYYRKRRKNTVKNEILVGQNSNSVFILDLLFFGLFFVQFLIIIINTEVGYPIQYYALFAATAGVLCAKIFTLSNVQSPSKSAHTIILQIILIIILFKLSFFTSSYQYQDDPGYHFYIAESIAEGSTDLDMGLPQYVFTYLFHVFYAYCHLLSGLTIEQVQFFTTVIQSVSIIFIYLLCKKITSAEKPSLLACLLFSIFPLGIEYGIITTTEGFSTLLVLFAVYLFYRLYIEGLNRSENGLRMQVLFALVFLATVFTHVQYSFITVLWCAILVLSSYFVSYFLEGGPPLKSLRGGLSMVFLLAATWLAKQLLSPLNDQFISVFQRALSAFASLGKGLQSVGSHYPYPYPPAELVDMLVSSWPTLIFFSFASLGFFLFFFSRSRRENVLALWVVSNFLVLAVGMVVGSRILLFSRFFYFSGILLALMGGIAIIYLVVNGPPRGRAHQLLKVGAVVAFVISLAFSSVVSETANNLDPYTYTYETPIYYPNTYAQRYMVDGSLQNVDLYDLTIVSDHRTLSRGSIPWDVWFSNMLIRFSTPELNELSELQNRTYVIINEASVERGMIFSYEDMIAWGWSVDREDIGIAVNPLDKVYDSKLISGYYGEWVP